MRYSQLSDIMQPRLTPKSNVLKALERNLPYEQLRCKLGRCWERPWIKTLINNNKKDTK